MVCKHQATFYNLVEFQSTRTLYLRKAVFTPVHLTPSFSLIGSADCGGPFDLWESNSTFSSPNYPRSYGDMANCEYICVSICVPEPRLPANLTCLLTSAGMWTLHAPAGQNIQLHFLDFDVEATYDMLEVRDGAGSNSTLLGRLQVHLSRVSRWVCSDSGDLFLFPPSCPHRQYWPCPRPVLHVQSDDGPVLHGQ